MHMWVSYPVGAVMYLRAGSRTPYRGTIHAMSGSCDVEYWPDSGIRYRSVRLGAWSGIPYAVLCRIVDGGLM